MGSGTKSTRHLCLAWGLGMRLGTDWNLVDNIITAVYFRMGKLFADMKFSLYSWLDLYRENIIREIIIATLHVCACTSHMASVRENLIHELTLQWCIHEYFRLQKFPVLQYVCHLMVSSGSLIALPSKQKPLPPADRRPFKNDYVDSLHMRLATAGMGHSVPQQSSTCMTEVRWRANSSLSINI